jgi:hypothetical protein
MTQLEACQVHGQHTWSLMTSAAADVADTLHMASLPSFASVASASRLEQADTKGAAALLKLTCKQRISQAFGSHTELPAGSWHTCHQHHHATRFSQSISAGEV